MPLEVATPNKNCNKDMTKDMTISNQTIIIKKVYIRRDYMLVQQ